MSPEQHPHTSLGEAISALGARVETVTQQLSELRVSGAADPAEVEETARVIDAAADELSAAHDDLKRDMEALRELLELELERVRYRDLFEASPEAYVVTDSSGLILDSNQAAAELFGIHRSALRGRAIARFVPTEERAAFGTRLSRMPTLEVVADWELNLLRGKGSAFPAAVTVAWSADRSGRTGQLRWLFRDITERRAAEARMVSANIELERRVRERTRTSRRWGARRRRHSRDSKPSSTRSRPGS